MEHIHHQMLDVTFFYAIQGPPVCFPGYIKVIAVTTRDFPQPVDATHSCMPHHGAPRGRIPPCPSYSAREIQRLGGSPVACSIRMVLGYPGIRVFIVTDLVWIRIQ